MADVIQNVKIKMSQEGAEQVGRSIRGVAREQVGLKDFVKAQRQEQRLQNFLFREGAGAALVFANVLGSTSESARKLTNSLNAGFTTFQGLNFMLASFNPAIGLTVGLIGGLAMALSQGGENAAELNKQIEINNQLKWDLGLSSAAERASFLADEIKRAETNLTELRRKAEATQNAPGVSAGIGMAGGPGNMLTGWIVSLFGTQKSDVLAGENTVLKKKKDLESFNKELDKSNSSIQNLQRTLEDADYVRNVLGINFTGPLPPGYNPVGNITPERMNALSPSLSVSQSGKLVGVEDVQLVRKFNLELDAGQQLLLDNMFALGDTLRSSLGGAFEEVFGEANSLLEQFGQRIFEILGSRLIGSLLSMIPGIGPILGAGFGTFGGGGYSPSVDSGLGRPNSGRIRYGELNARNDMIMHFVASRLAKQQARLGT